VFTCGKFEYCGIREAQNDGTVQVSIREEIERSLFWLAQFLARTLKPAPELWIGFTKWNGRFLYSPFFLLKVPPDIGLMV
jgi:hypothetical protein